MRLNCDGEREAYFEVARILLVVFVIATPQLS